MDFVENLIGDFAGDFSGDLAGNFAGDFAGNFAGDYVGDYVGPRCRKSSGLAAKAHHEPAAYEKFVHLGQRKTFLRGYSHKPVAQDVALNHTVAQDVQHV